jgi:hypothetical protein
MAQACARCKRRGATKKVQGVFSLLYFLSFFSLLPYFIIASVVYCQTVVRLSDCIVRLYAFTLVAWDDTRTCIEKGL